MEFLYAALIGLILLGLASFVIVETGFHIVRIYSRLSYWFRYHYLSWESERQVSALKRRYGSTKGPVPFGRLRFTRSRASDFDRESSGIEE